MLIKAGTYRFNDVLTQGHFTNDINGLNEVYFDYQTVATINGEAVTLYCNTIYQEPEPQSGVGSLQYTCVSSIPDLSALGITYPFSRYVSDGGKGIWRTDDFGTGIQTITIPNDSEVSAEFYSWLTENATPVMEPTVRGKWRFNDTIVGSPVDDGTTSNAYLKQSVMFSAVASIPGYGDFVASCTEIETGVHSIDGVEVYFHVESLEPTMPGYDLPNNMTVYRDGWLLGERVKTIDFGTEAQIVSVEFYEWLNKNANELKQVSGKWKFNDVLTRPTVEIDEHVNFEFALHYPFGGATYDAIGKGDRIYTARAATGNTVWGLNYHYTIYFTDLPEANETPASAMKGVYSNFDEQWLKDSEGEYQTIDFGSEPQTVSKAFYDWLIENASRHGAFVWYNGSAIATLFGGDTATLKCKGMKMDTDVIVETTGTGGESSKPILQEKTATKNGEVLPDAGYDGLSKVNVAVSVIEEFDGTIYVR